MFSTFRFRRENQLGIGHTLNEEGVGKPDANKFVVYDISSINKNKKT